MNPNRNPIKTHLATETLLVFVSASTNVTWCELCLLPTAKVFTCKFGMVQFLCRFHLKVCLFTIPEPKVTEVGYVSGFSFR